MSSRPSITNSPKLARTKFGISISQWTPTPTPRKNALTIESIRGPRRQSTPSPPSPFAGKKIEEVAEWLTAAPEEVDLDRRFFAVLDENSTGNDTLTIARTGDGGVESAEGEVQYFPIPATEAASYLNSMKSNGFDERLQGYQRKRERSQEEDLSKGEPFNGPGLKE